MSLTWKLTCKACGNVNVDLTLFIHTLPFQSAILINNGNGPSNKGSHCKKKKCTTKKDLEDEIKPDISLKNPRASVYFIHLFLHF